MSSTKPSQSIAGKPEKRVKRKHPEPDTATEENEASPLRELIPDGDVILVVGPKKIKIQLSSHLLRSTSPVFAAMLGPNFKEGALLRESQGPVEIALPEDNADAFWNLYSALYGAHPRAHNLAPDDVYDIAFLADKYDLVERLALAREAWFRGADTTYYISTKATFKMLVAAYWLGSEFGFAYVSQTLVKDYHQPLYKYGMETKDQILGLKLCCE
ncbi:hypothetical protein N0V84_008983 [Fusarium piperis]|uniref:BTB domain-containing protein n=1 Tax=Fusarium piperis TaxID=1435070 RepID=A0A9W8W767_9HYPO|nr:hypothetical protein N0V84_008983 [Fusarium piperis]